MLNFLDKLIPSQFKSNSTDLMRCYFFLGTLLSHIFIFIVACICLYFIELEPEQKRTGWILASILLVSDILILFLFKYTGQYKKLSNFLILNTLIVLFISIHITGGFAQSPFLQLILITPIMAFLLNGLRDGSYWLIFIAASCLISYSVSSGFGLYTNWLPENFLSNLSALVYFILFALIGTTLMVYETINQHLKHKLYEENTKFKHETRHDNLTGAPNRLEFFRRLSSGITESSNRDQKLALLYIDLNGFKPINDKHGNYAGDQLLIEVTKRLMQLLRTSDTVARLGGDEFAIILPGIKSIEDVNTLTEKILNTIRRPFAINDSTSVSIQTSIGIAIFPEDTRDTDELCRRADEAMQRSKTLQNTACYFNDNFVFRTQDTGDLEVQSEVEIDKQVSYIESMLATHAAEEGAQHIAKENSESSSSLLIEEPEDFYKSLEETPKTESSGLSLLEEEN